MTVWKLKQKITQLSNVKLLNPVAQNAKASTKLGPSIAWKDLPKTEGWYTLRINTFPFYLVSERNI